MAMDMGISKELIEKLKDLSIVAHKTRFRILVSLFNSNLIKSENSSQTFKELKRVVNSTSPDVSYHLNLLRKIDLVDKKKKFYYITKKGKKILKEFGVNKTVVNKINKKIAS